MKKLLSNKWGKFLIVAAYSLIFFVATFIVTASALKEGGTDAVALGAILLYVSIPALYFVTVLLNYLRFALTKFVRYILYIACMILFIVGTIAIFVGCIADGHIINDPAGYAFVYGMNAGSLVTWTLLFLDFRKLGYKPENAEGRTWLYDVILWGIYFLAPFILNGFVFLIIHAIKKTFIVIVLLIAFVALTAGAVYKSISDYGSPLGSSKEWQEYLKKHGYRSSGGSSSSSSSSSGSSSGSSTSPTREVLADEVYHKILGMYHSFVEVVSAGVYPNGKNNFDIELTLRDTYNGSDKGDNWGNELEAMARELINEVAQTVSNMGASCSIRSHFE